MEDEEMLRLCLLKRISNFSNYNAKLMTLNIISSLPFEFVLEDSCYQMRTQRASVASYS
jgi:hypothetical protein